MKEKIKNTLYFLLTTLILLFSADVISVYLISGEGIEVCCDCPDFSKHPNHSHNHPIEDEVLLRDSNLSQERPEVSNDFVPKFDFFLSDIYFSKVWQPPKAS